MLVSRKVTRPEASSASYSLFTDRKLVPPAKTPRLSEPRENESGYCLIQ